MSADILLTNTENQLNNRALYQTQIEVDEKEFTGLLFLFDNVFTLVVHKGDNRYRNYSWSYKFIKSIAIPLNKTDINKETIAKPKLHITLLPNPELYEQEDQLLRLSFQGDDCDRDKFTFRLKILAQIYKGEKMALNISRVENKTNTTRNEPSTQKENSIDDSDDILSVSSLSKLAGPTKVSPGTTRTCMRLKSSPTPRPGQDEFFSAENLSKLAGPAKTVIPSPTKSPDGVSSTTTTNNNETTVSSNGKMSIPIEVNSGGTKFILNAEATLTLKMNMDLMSIIAAQKITDEKKRLQRIRDLIQLDATVCELNFS